MGTRPVTSWGHAPSSMVHFIPDMPPSSYTIYHAAVTAIVLVGVVFLQGFHTFWRLFLHGINTPMTPTVLLQNLLATLAQFGGLAFLLWATTLPMRRRAAVCATASAAPNRLDAVRTACLWALGFTPLAILLHLASGFLIKLLTGIEPADQMLVGCFTDGHYPLAIRLALMAAVVLQAPLLEEVIFRSILLRGLASKLPFAWAAALSGLIFAFVHVNAASFVALWFLGVVFAVLYRKTGTLLAPICAHACFNAINLALLLLFPEAAA